MLLKNGLTESWTYNAKLQPTQMTVGSLLTLNYGYGAPNGGNNGNVYSQTMQRGSNTWSQTYAYDLLNRLETAQETGAGSWTESYEYDAFGNRWLCAASSCANPVGSSATDPGRAGLPGATLEMPVAASWYNGNNQIIGWQYDPSGNITQVGGMTRSFTYDGENRQATGSVAGATVTYAYDGDGRRVGKTVMWPAGMQSADNLPSQQTTVYVYDASGQLAAEYGPATESGTTYLTVDSLGSTRLETNGSGQVVRNYDYLPFGQDLGTGTAGRDSTFAAAVYPGPSSGPGMFFTGKERDAESGLDYFGARYMSSAQGRFTSPDPMDHPSQSNMGLEGFLADPQRWNKYAYTLNNPLRFVDPDGHEAQQTFDAQQMRSIKGDMDWAVTHPVTTVAAIGTLAVAPEAGGILSSLRTAGSAAFGWMLGHPQQVQETAAGIAEGLSNAPPGSLTSGFARLGATTAESVERKLSQYLLNPEHAVGGDKAKWFQQALGFTKDNMADLAKQIIFDPKKAIQTGATEFGTKYNQTIAITGANGKTINVVAAWIRHKDNVVRLVTAVPEK
jgi:RHS repeat-associated protein